MKGLPDSLFLDPIAFSISRDEMVFKTIKVLKLVRSALQYLCLAVHVEEGKRREKMEPNAVVPGSPLDVWQDEWKR